MNTRLAGATGVAAGVGLMYLLDPQQGRRRRAAVRDKLVHSIHVATDALDTTRRDLAHRVQGMAASARARFRHEQVPDDVLVARVRSRLGRVVSHPHAVHVRVMEGRVILEGPILEHEVARLLRAVRRVRGVKEVDNRLTVHRDADSVPGLQGGVARTGARFEWLQESWSPTTRLLAVLGGGALVALAGIRRGPMRAALSVAGGGLLLRGLTNVPFSRLVGVGAGRRGIDIQKTIEVAAPVEEVYRFWRNPENFPRFMRNVREVRPAASPGQTHWVVDGPAGVPVEFDSVVTEEVPNRLLAWKTLEGAPVAHAGIVRFQPAPTGTRVHVRMTYNPPAGVLGHAIAWLTGEDPKRKLDEDLLRMKTFIETGRPPHDRAAREAAGVH
ncbi:MAG TPA: SRPBCC family protein [Vicinamibacterales bacterium]|nr:SRPBCC family protein [Vicinamibacterales bacterium]